MMCAPKPRTVVVHQRALAATHVIGAHPLQPQPQYSLSPQAKSRHITHAKMEHPCRVQTNKQGDATRKGPVTRLRQWLPTCKPARCERETAFVLAFPESLPALPPAISDCAEARTKEEQTRPGGRSARSRRPLLGRTAIQTAPSPAFLAPFIPQNVPSSGNSAGSAHQWWPPALGTRP